MNVARSLWCSIQGSPIFMRRVNGWLTIFWILMIPVSLITRWVELVVYVSALSLWALVSGHWSAWQAARVETNQDEDADVAEVLAEVRALRQQIQDATDAEWARREPDTHRLPAGSEAAATGVLLPVHDAGQPVAPPQAQGDQG